MRRSVVGTALGVLSDCGSGLSVRVRRGVGEADEVGALVTSATWAAFGVGLDGVNHTIAPASTSTDTPETPATTAVFT
ncbi:MAG: hypothetical protein HOV96_39405, partial [Nonomuraea sp.]|nr:hypothetical protein [Nonomuraea sp.]